jgi:hypothetical protein
VSSRQAIGSCSRPQEQWCPNCVLKVSILNSPFEEPTRYWAWEEGKPVLKERPWPAAARPPRRRFESWRRWGPRRTRSGLRPSQTGGSTPWLDGRPAPPDLIVYAETTSGVSGMGAATI